MPTTNTLPNKPACLQNSKANKNTSTNEVPILQANKKPEIKANEETYEVPWTDRLMPTSLCVRCSNLPADVSTIVSANERANVPTDVTANAFPNISTNGLSHDTTTNALSYGNTKANSLSHDTTTNALSYGYTKANSLSHDTTTYNVLNINLESYLPQCFRRLTCETTEHHQTRGRNRMSFYPIFQSHQELNFIRNR